MHRATAASLLALTLTTLVSLPAAARDLDEIRESGELRVLFLRFEDSPYFELDEAGEARGFDLDLLQRFAQRHRVRLVVDSSPDVEDVLRRVAEGEADVGAGGITATPDRRERVDVTGPVTPQRHVVTTWRRPPVDDLSQLATLRVATAAGSSWETALDDIGFPQDHRVYPDSFSAETYVRILRDGEADAAATGLVFALLMRRHDSGIGLGLLLGETGHHGWVVRPGTDDLLAALDKFLIDAQDEDSWEAAVSRHFGEGAADLFRRAQR